MPVIIGVNFLPVHGSGPDHVFEAWSGPNIGGPRTRSPTKFWHVKKSVTDVSAMFPDMLIIAFHFSP